MKAFITACGRGLNFGCHGVCAVRRTVFSVLALNSLHACRVCRGIISLSYSL